MKVSINDITTYSQQDREKIPRVLDVRIDGLEFSYRVHRNIYYPGTWFVTCDRLRIAQEDLKTDSLDEAIHASKVFMMGVIDGMMAWLGMTRKVLEESEELTLCPH